MTLLQLQYALSVQKHGHFGKAAEANFVTQPTLSQQIQKLEELLDSAKRFEELQALLKEKGIAFNDSAAA